MDVLLSMKGHQARGGSGCGMLTPTYVFVKAAEAMALERPKSPSLILLSLSRKTVKKKSGSVRRQAPDVPDMRPRYAREPLLDTYHSLA